jgi:hypothetical protein
MAILIITLCRTMFVMLLSHTRVLGAEDVVPGG